MRHAIILISLVAAAQNPIPPDLAAMADTEREFARTAAVKGWRDAFLDFFADDSIAFNPQAVSAKDRLRGQPSAPVSEFELIWEPRTGDVASSGDLGWLTGPSTSIAHKGPETKTGYGCYLSVWRKQPDGKWRVFIDVGASAPEPVAFPAGFTRTTLQSRYAGGETKEVASRSLAEADRDLNAQIGVRGIAAAFEDRLAPSARLHRIGTVPMLARDAIVAWLGRNMKGVTATHGAAEASAAGDLGYSYGTLDVKDPNPITGAYIRLWNRDAAARWWLMVDVTQPIRP